MRTLELRPCRYCRQFPNIEANASAHWAHLTHICEKANDGQTRIISTSVFKAVASWNRWQNLDNFSDTVLLDWLEMNYKPATDMHGVGDNMRSFRMRVLEHPLVGTSFRDAIRRAIVRERDRPI